MQRLAGNALAAFSARYPAAKAQIFQIGGCCRRRRPSAAVPCDPKPQPSDGDRRPVDAVDVCIECFTSCFCGFRKGENQKTGRAG